MESASASSRRPSTTVAQGRQSDARNVARSDLFGSNRLYSQQQAEHWQRCSFPLDQFRKEPFRGRWLSHHQKSGFSKDSPRHLRDLGGKAPSPKPKQKPLSV